GREILVARFLATGGAEPTWTPPPVSPTTCPPGVFLDVHPGDYYYTPVTMLATSGALYGYDDCTYRPYLFMTRGDVAQLGSAAFPLKIYDPDPGIYTFADVPRSYPVFSAAETVWFNNVMAGYACGGSGEPCDGEQRPYFRPDADVTRSQLAKITALGM